MILFSRLGVSDSLQLVGRFSNLKQFSGSVPGKTDFSRILIFVPPDFFRGFSRRILSPQFGGKVPRTTLQENPRQNPPKFMQQKSPTHFCRGAGPTVFAKAKQRQKFESGVSLSLHLHCLQITRHLSLCLSSCLFFSCSLVSLSLSLSLTHSLSLSLLSLSLSLSLALSLSLSRLVPSKTCDCSFLACVRAYFQCCVCYLYLSLSLSLLCFRAYALTRIERGIYLSLAPRN